MHDIPHEIEAYPVAHLPIVKAYADKLDLVGLINDFVPTEMDVDAGTIVLGLVLDTLSGRSPLYRLEEFFAHQDTELLLGKPLPPHAFNDDTVGRVLDRLYDMSTMKIFTACAVRAAARFGVECRYVHFDTTSRRLWGDYQCAEAQDVPFRVTYGYSKDKRPDLKQFVLSLLCVDRTVPIWGKPEDGHASDTTLNTTLLSEIATILARHGVAPGASIDVADAALVTEDNLAALGNTLFISRLPATYTACERVIQEAVARDGWEDIGILATTRATKHRPATCYRAYEGEVALYGQTYRAIVVSSTAQDNRRLPRLAREVHASAEGLQAVVRVAETYEYVCQADAEVAAARLRASQTPYHDVVVRVEERPKDGRGRPRQHTPRAVKTMRYGLKCTLKERDATMVRKREEAGCFVWLTNVPAEGDLGHRAGDVLRGYKNQHGIEQNFSFLKDPLIVNSLFLKKPERIEALGLVLWLALLLWRLMERSLRHHVDTTGTPVTGWDKKTTDRPTALMMVTKFSGLMVVKVDQQRHLARALSSVQQQYLTALSVQATCFTTPTRGEETGRGGNTLCLTVRTEAVRVGCGAPSACRVDITPSPGVGPCPPGQPGPSPSSSLAP